jgi:type I restriction enzyme S subunit
LRNGHSAKKSETGEGVPTLTLSAVTYNDFSAENIKATVADPSKVADLWLEPGDILVERANTPELVGTAAIFPGPSKLAIFPDLMIRVRITEAVRARFLSLFMNSDTVRRYFRGRAQGIAGTMPKIDQTTIEQLSVPLPPLPEQDRIVAAIEQHLSDIDAGVAALERVQANLKRYRASVLKAACEGRLVPTEAELARREGRRYEPASALLTRILAERRARWEADQLAKMKAKGQTPKDGGWKAKYEEPTGPDVRGLPTLPEGWVWASLSQLSSRITSGARDWSGYYGRGRGTFVLAQNVRMGRLDLSFRQLVDPPDGDASIERSRICQGDLLVTIVGAGTGAACMVPTPVDDHFVCQSVALIRPVFSSISSFLDRFLCSDHHGQAQFARATYGQGRPHLGFEHLEATVISLPPATEQARIVAEADRLLSVADQTLSVVEAQLLRAQSLRQAVLQRAFEGKLVAQDPADEPASVLLARLGQPQARFSRGRKPAVKPAAPAPTPAPVAPKPVLQVVEGPGKGAGKARPAWTIGDAIAELRAGEGLSVAGFAARFEMEAEVVGALEALAVAFERKAPATMRQLVMQAHEGMDAAAAKMIVDALIAASRGPISDTGQPVQMAASELP